MKYLVCYNGKWLKVPRFVYKDYFDIIEHLDDSERSRELKIAVFKHILKRSDDYGKKVKLFNNKRKRP